MPKKRTSEEHCPEDNAPEQGSFFSCIDSSASSDLFMPGFMKNEIDLRELSVVELHMSKEKEEPQMSKSDNIIFEDEPEQSLNKPRLKCNSIEVKEGAISEIDENSQLNSERKSSVIEHDPSYGI